MWQAREKIRSLSSPKAEKLSFEGFYPKKWTQKVPSERNGSKWQLVVSKNDIFLLISYPNGKNELWRSSGGDLYMSKKLIQTWQKCCFFSFLLIWPYSMTKKYYLRVLWSSKYSRTTWYGYIRSHWNEKNDFHNFWSNPP